MATIGSKARQFWQHPAGPKTIHFWAPTFKWGISIANVADFKRPVEQVSYPQQIAVTATGLIWSRFATQITPVSVNIVPVLFLLNGRAAMFLLICSCLCVCVKQPCYPETCDVSCSGELQFVDCQRVHGIHRHVSAVQEDWGGQRDRPASNSSN